MSKYSRKVYFTFSWAARGADERCGVVALRPTTLCPKKASTLSILQQPPQTCTDLNEILHTQDDIYFCHRRQIS